jgi:pimeloyl-ACP methyl ester carboxylesterase
MRHIGFGITVGIVALAIHTQAAAQAPPYHEEELTFASGGVTIACTLTTPAGGGPAPAVVLLSGSGPQNRDSDLMGFRPFRIIADHLARTGVAVLRCDDRGVGGSSGSIADSTTAEFADDALAAIRTLAGRTNIRKDRIGLIGHSEGALSAAIAAAESRDVAFVVWMAGSAIRGDAIMQGQAADLARAAGADAATVDRVVAAHRRLLQAVSVGAEADEMAKHIRVTARTQLELLPEAQRKAMGDLDAAIEKMLPPQVAFMRSKWMRFFVEFDPAIALARVSCPVLAVFGERDMQVPPATNRTVLETALTRGGNDQVVVKVYPQANHLFQPAITGDPSEYATLPKVFVPALLDDLSAWIVAR